MKDEVLVFELNTETVFPESIQWPSRNIGSSRTLEPFALALASDYFHSPASTQQVNNTLYCRSLTTIQWLFF